MERGSVESVAERNRAEARIKDLDGSLCVQPEQPAPERPESTKRGRSVNRGREAWPQEKKTKKSCCCTADAKMLDRGTCRHYELVSPLWRFSLSTSARHSSGRRVTASTTPAWISRRLRGPFS
ncbi:hypothetical protein ALC57_02812 [Trachymyrmex cornetzi]|uniref:Uncharacterized protein n=2 Tax=Trachymyrmex TaxID=34717 RepID=A0A195EHK1_9HYME|nr:hypothetical protein ALC57_02812 [Trachymyrmex cornetzi]